MDRVVQEYTRRFYHPAMEMSKTLAERDYAQGLTFADWLLNTQLAMLVKNSGRSLRQQERRDAAVGFRIKGSIQGSQLVPRKRPHIREHNRASCVNFPETGGRNEPWAVAQVLEGL